MRPHSERSHKTLYLQQLHVLHSQFSDAPCVRTAREATKPCTHNSTSSTLNSSTHPAPTQRERPQGPVLTTTPCLLLSILQRNPASTHRDRQPSPASVAGKTTQPYSNLSHTLGSLTHLASTQRERQPSPVSQATGKATQPCLRSGKGNPALR